MKQRKKFELLVKKFELDGEIPIWLFVLLEAAEQLDSVGESPVHHLEAFC